MISELLKREFSLRIKDVAGLILPLVFFVLFISLCVFGIGSEQAVLRRLAASLIWLALLFSLMLSHVNAFQDDFEDGSLEQLTLAGVSGNSLIITKWISTFILCVIPLILVTPVAAAMLGIGRVELLGLVASIMIGAPALVAYFMMISALLCGQKNMSVLGVIMSAPLIFPVFIFGVSAAKNFPENGIMALEFQALAGLCLLSIAVAIPAAAAAIKANIDT